MQPLDTTAAVSHDDNISNLNWDEKLIPDLLQSTTAKEEKKCSVTKLKNNLIYSDDRGNCVRCVNSTTPIHDTSINKKKKSSFLD